MNIHFYFNKKEVMKSLINGFKHITISVSLGLALFVVVGVLIATNIGTLADRNASHIPSGTRLGELLDTESASQPDVNANGDDDPGTTDDEDGPTAIILRVQRAYTPEFGYGLVLAIASALLFSMYLLFFRKRVVRGQIIQDQNS